MSRHPTMKWAQRSDKIYLIVELPDAKDVKIDLEPEGKFSFFATKDGFPYAVDLELFDKINVKSKLSIGARSIVYVLKKTDKKWWRRLLHEDAKPPDFIKVDWDKWIDEDDENEQVGKDSDDRKKCKPKLESKKRHLLMRKLKFGCSCKK